MWLIITPWSIVSQLRGSYLYVLVQHQVLQVEDESVTVLLQVCDHVLWVHLTSLVPVHWPLSEYLGPYLQHKHHILPA